MYTRTPTCRRTHTCMYACTHVPTYACTPAHTYSYSPTLLHTHMHTLIRACVHIHMHTHVYTYACVHTKTFSCNISSESANSVLQCESVQWIHSVFCLTVSTEQQRIVTCGSDRLLKVIDMETLTELFAKDVQHEIL